MPSIVDAVANSNPGFKALRDNSNTDVFSQRFACENSKGKIKLMEQNGLMSSAVPVFRDVCKLAGKSVKVWGGDAKVVVPWCCIFIAGFVCKSVSRLNKHHSDHKDAIKKRKGETSQTWWGCFNYVKSMRRVEIHTICDHTKYKYKTNARGSVTSQFSKCILYVFSLRFFPRCEISQFHNQTYCQTCIVSGLANNCKQLTLASSAKSMC